MKDSVDVRLRFLALSMVKDTVGAVGSYCTVSWRVAVLPAGSLADIDTTVAAQFGVPRVGAWGKSMITIISIIIKVVIIVIVVVIIVIVIAGGRVARRVARRHGHLMAAQLGVPRVGACGGGFRASREHHHHHHHHHRLRHRDHIIVIIVMAVLPAGSLVDMDTTVLAQLGVPRVGAWTGDSELESGT
jgi:hypothetical protein